ncbi:SDR family NAD(P)-dependent oxidoreductase [Saxibacter everestensis]|uniref:SDR family NAD(P)-dependent oxidoreductase n=1 Tax=Saxibacter everestensis TaxID=2909229 RepID=A0ABY8QYM1_9MICO|nr:SDR family NAD(P)-dependent oxidoreductase [Brevibacteriaceae bacterium ZFBP1038]
MATAMVTGGHSGIGAAFARAFAKRGVNLVLVARNSDRLEAVAAELRTSWNINVETLAVDLADRAETLRLAERLTDPARPVDVLVNNAGFGIRTRLLDPDTATIERGLDVMCRAVLILGGTAGREMRQRGRGTIINVSSVSGAIAMGAYSAVKSWVTTYSEGLAVELAGTGVTVTALCPGWVRTNFHESAGINAAKIPSQLWLDADDVVEQCLKDSARGKVISVPSKRFTLLNWAARHLPRSVIRAVSARLSAGRSSPGSAGRSSP